MMKKTLIILNIFILLLSLASCAVADSMDKMMYPEYYVEHTAYIVNATHYDVEVKVIAIYQQELITHSFIQPKSTNINNMAISPWVIKIKVRLDTYRIMVTTRDGRTNGYQSFMLYEADFVDNKSPVWIITETVDKKIKVLQRFYNGQ